MENLQVSVISRFTAVAAASGNDAITAGLSAGSGELAAPMIAKWMFGTDKAEKLTAEQKSTVSNITAILPMQSPADVLAKMRWIITMYSTHQTVRWLLVIAEIMVF